jgi:2-dehydropantoate 2-reductase
MEAIHIVGAGGIGCAVGYALRSSGIPVLFVEKNPHKVRAGNQFGVSVAGHAPLPAEFREFADWQPAPGTCIFLCTKCYDNAAILDRLSAPIQLIPIQNGFDHRLDAHDHTHEGIASFVSECDSDSPHVRITRPGKLHFGRRRTTRIESANHHLDLTSLRGHGGANPWKWEGGFSVRGVADILPIKYAKLMYNAAISPLAAAAGIDNGKLLSVARARALFFALLQENYAILRAAGVTLGTVGPFHPRTVAWILRRSWLAGLLAKCFEPSLRGTYCSMAGEIQKGKTEIGNYNGHLIRLAEQAALPCPMNRSVTALVDRMTKGRERSALEILNEIPLPRDLKGARYLGP